jgi:tungstate transport system ATP-binding protein
MRAEPSILPLRLEGLGFSAGGRQLIGGLYLTVQPGRRLVVLGPNGAGKSLLLRLCHGLLEPSAGRVAWALPGAMPRAQGMVFQRPVLLRRSVRGNLEHALALAGLTRERRRRRCEAALARFGLEPLAGQAARRLSGGEQQRLAMARAWALRPQVLFLDEPCAQLDPAATGQIEAIVRGFGEDGTTVVMTTHDLAQARRLADDVAFLYRGRLLEAGPARAFFAGPRSAEARAFLTGELLW